MVRRGPPDELVRIFDIRWLEKPVRPRSRALLKTRSTKKEETEKKFRDHSLFIGFAPLDDPKIAIAVVIEHGGSGSRTAAPIARKLIDYYLLERLRLFPEGESDPKIASND